MRARLLTALVLAGCAATPPRASTRQELVIDEATVVRVPRRSAGSAGTAQLPALPEPIAGASPSFQRGVAHAHQLLRAAGPSAPPEQDDEVAAKAWLDTQFRPWLEQRLSATDALVEFFAGISPAGAPGSASEHVVAAALLGLVYGNVYDQLTAIPAPAHVRGDPALLRVYQNELHATIAGRLLGTAIVAHRGCAAAAAEQHDAAFGPWLELCHAELAMRLQQQSRALALQQQVEAERAAERTAAEGTRPPGPEVCWTPTAVAATEVAVPEGAPAEGAPNVPGPDAAGVPPDAEDCALAGQARDPLADRTLSARDLRYGARDPETSVRVSVALADSSTMDARPLAWLATRSRLSLCFATHVPESEAITVAVNASLAIDARGKTQSVALTPEPSDASAAPSKPLEQCLRRALTQTAFGCSPTGQPTQARATFCLRRD
jgi:hypothetical protein